MSNQDGLEWVLKIFGLEPQWTREPEISKIEQLGRQHLNIPPGASCDVAFHAQGGFNKLYKIQVKGKYALMRVTLPVDPGHKTNSEVATINFVRQLTHMPVPEIFAFDDSSNNVLGFEWILMEMLPGKPLQSKWRKLSTSAKQDLVRQIAFYQAQLFRHQFDAIGNIFCQHGSSLMKRTQTQGTIQESLQEASLNPTVGRIVSMIFFWGDHINQDIPRGPFSRSEDWIKSRLSLILADQEKILSVSDDEDDLEESQDTKDLVERLLKILPEVFSSMATDQPEATMLFHDDLSMQNILVDDSGQITGIIDWECVSALPLWRACQLPHFLEGRERNEEPNRSEYDPDNGEGNETGEQEPLDNEGVNSLYWEHLKEWELTQLRELFLQEMRNLVPEWISYMVKGANKADFELAVQNCDDSGRTRVINGWLNARENGEEWSLRRKLFE